jgi:hypothetical protein
LAEAEVTYQQALAEYEKMLSPEHISTLSIVNSLCLLYYRQGKPAEAEKTNLRALKGYEKALDPERTSTATSC